jgi:hypothetical protein
MLLKYTNILLAISVLGGAITTTQMGTTFAQVAPEGEISKVEVVQKKQSIAQTLTELRNLRSVKTEVKVEGDKTSVKDVLETAKEVLAEPKTVTRIACRGCNANEQKTLDFLQSRGIKDRHALATVMGNIKQESMFVSNICEGGARIPYGSCRSGGYGIIQWTSSNRYYGLGSFANRYGGNPSNIDTQLRYMVTEPQWRRIEPALKAGGNSVNGYMRHAYSWLGWGIHGARTHYSNGYLNRLYTATDVVNEENGDTQVVQVPKVVETVKPKTLNPLMLNW